MAWYKPWTWGDESQSAKDQRSGLNNQADQADSMRQFATDSFGSLTTESGAMREALRQQAMGEKSFTGEQLRQGLQQQQAAQMSMAAGASPGNSAMAARTAAMQMGRNQGAMAGQASLAGIAERQAALKQWQDAILQHRQQDIGASLGAGQNAIGALTGQKPEGSFIDKWGGAASGALGYGAGGSK